MTERTIFLAAIEIADPTERLAYLDQACGGDEALRSQVDELLKSHAQGSQFLESPPTSAEEFAATVVHQVPSPDDETRAEEKPDNSDFLKYLQPATRPGWLGRLKHHEIEQILGRGAFGIVAKAFDEKLHRVVAIKMLNPEMATTSPPRKRFLREARTAAAVHHENIVGIYDVEEEPIPYIVMEFVPGKTLTQRLDEHGPLEVPEVLSISRQIAAGLAASHAVNLIHRDIKPANILLDGIVGGRVKISDFGLARAVDDASLTTSGMIAGTPMYMAPEQARGETLDHRADLFSLGSVMYQMVSGRPPFRAANTVAVLKRVCEDAPRPIPDVIPGTPDWLCAIISKLHEKDRTRRFQSARDVVDLLTRCQEELRLFGRVTCVSGSSPGPSVSSSRQSEELTTTVRPADSLRPLLSPLRVLSFIGSMVLFLLLAQGIIGWGAQLTGWPVRIQHGLTAAGAAVAMLLGWGVEAWAGQRKQRRLAEVSSGIAASACLLAAANGFMMWLEKPGNRPNEEKSQPVVQAGAGTNSAVATVPPVAGQPGPSQDGWYGLPADAPKPAIAPFDADQAKQHQAEWAAYLKVPVEYTNSLGMKFRLIPPGEFLMGSTAEEIDRVVKAVPEEVSWTREFVKGEAPQHKVVLTQPIYVGINTVTQAEYEKLIGKNPSFFSKTGPEKQLVEKVAGLDTSNHPVEGVSWNDAVVFCVKLSEQDHFQPFYLADRETVTALEGNGYRLPSEAEWEFACRAGTETRYWSGDTDEDVKRVAWLAGTANDRTQPVGELPANPFGLHDVHGNVSQWIQDGWNVNAYGTSLDHLRIDPKPPFTTASSHVVRGGYWWGPEYYCRSAARNITDRNARTHSTGFRMVVTVDAVRQSLQQKSTNLSWHGWPADAPKPAIAPFDAGQAKAHQEGWAKYLKLPLEYETAGVKFHLIPPGEFRMGASESDADAQPYEKPQHVVSLTQPFYISTTELTVGQFQRFVDATKYVTEAESDGQGAFDISPRVRRPANVWNGKSSRTADADYPVRSVSWQDAGRYCEWLSQIAGRTARLPTEAEWEFACRAGTQTRYSFGDRVADIAHPPRGNGAPLSIVAQGPANPFGLFDMHGNVHELCLDSGRTYTAASEINPIGSVDPMTSPVVRGGAVSGDASRMRSSHRYLNDQRQFPGLNFATMVKGFRVVLVPRFSNPAPTADQPK